MQQPIVNDHEEENLGAAVDLGGPAAVMAVDAVDGVAAAVAVVAVDGDNEADTAGGGGAEHLAPPMGRGHRVKIKKTCGIC